MTRSDVGKPSSRFDVGDICEVIGAAQVRAAEDLGSAKVAQLRDGCRIQVTGIGSGASGKRIRVQDTGEVEGWVSVVSSTGEALVRIVEKELLGDVREKRIASALKAARHDHGKATARFDVGDACHVIATVIMRQMEELDSPKLATLSDRTLVKVLEIGLGRSGKRLRVVDEQGLVGWVSVVSSDGTQLLRRLTPEAAAPEEPEKAVAVERVEQRSLFPVADALAKLPFVLVSSSRAQRGFELEISYLQREDIEQLLVEKFASEGVQEPSYDHLKLRDATGKWYRPWESPETPTPEIFPIMVYYRPPKPKQCAELVVAQRKKEAYDALSPVQRKGLSEVQRQLERAYDLQNHDLVERAVRMAHSMGLPLGTGGLLPPLMPESVCFPQGSEPLLYDGHIYSMQSSSLLVFDPPDFSMPMGIWNAQRQRIDPAVLQTEHPGRSDIVHFGKTFHMLEQGHIVDPDSQQVVGMIRPFTGDFEFFDPIPLQVADFMMRRGFRLEAPSAKLTSAPFVQILPEEEDPHGHPELHLHMQSAGNAKALKYAPIQDRDNKDLVMRAMQGEGPQSWKVMLYGTEKLRNDRDVLAEAVKQDYSAMVYASPFYGDRDFMLKAVQNHGLALRYGSEEIRSDPDLAYAAVKASWRALRNVAERLRGSSRIVREAVKQCWQALEYASEELQDDKDLVSLALKQSWRCLRFASLRLRRDPALMLKALERSPEALQYAAPGLLDRDFMAQAVKVDGLALRYAEELDRDLALEAVRGTWRALEFCGAFRAHRAVVWEALRQHPGTLRLACETLQEDEELVFEAAKRRPELLGTVSEELRGNRGLMLRMVKMHPMSLQYASESLRRDEDLVLEALKRNFRCLQHAPELRRSRSFMLRAVQVDAFALSLADEELLQDPAIAYEAMEREWEMLEHVSEELRANYDFMMEAVGIEGLALKYAAEKLSGERELVLAALSNSGKALEFVAPQLRSDAELVLAALRQDPESLHFADEELTGDFQFMLRAVRLDGLALQGASRALKSDPDLILAAVSCNWRSLKYASRALRSNLDFMLQCVRTNSYCLSLAVEDLWMDPSLLAAAAQDLQEISAESCLEESPVDQDLWELLQQARPSWSDNDLHSAVRKLAVIGVRTLTQLSEALASDLNGRLRTAGQKLFTATTVMELKARCARVTRPRATSSRPNARLNF